MMAAQAVADVAILAPVKCSCGKVTNVAALKGTQAAIYNCKRCGFTGTVTV